MSPLKTNFPERSSTAAGDLGPIVKLYSKPLFRKQGAEALNKSSKIKLISVLHGSSVAEALSIIP